MTLLKQAPRLTSKGMQIQTHSQDLSSPDPKGRKRRKLTLGWGDERPWEQGCRFSEPLSQ